MICALVGAVVVAVGAAFIWELMHPFADMEVDDGNPEQ